ncbi:hypothetical protein EV182_007914, partial [Spiromyces aspiralis]
MPRINVSLPTLITTTNEQTTHDLQATPIRLEQELRGATVGNKDISVSAGKQRGQLGGCASFGHRGKDHAEQEVEKRKGEGVNNDSDNRHRVMAVVPDERCDDATRAATNDRPAETHCQQSADMSAKKAGALQAAKSSTYLIALMAVIMLGLVSAGWHVGVTNAIESYIMDCQDEDGAGKSVMSPFSKCIKMSSLA